MDFSFTNIQNALKKMPAGKRKRKVGASNSTLKYVSNPYDDILKRNLTLGRNLAGRTSSLGV